MAYFEMDSLNVLKSLSMSSGTIYVPSATAVTLNGNTVAFTRSGNYIYAASVIFTSAANTSNPTDDSHVRGKIYTDNNYGSGVKLEIKDSTSKTLNLTALDLTQGQ